MPKVKIKRLGAKRDRKDIGKVGEVVEVDDTLAKALVAFALAEPVKADEKPKAEKPAENREKAESKAATERETREVVKNRPGRPRKSEG